MKELVIEGAAAIVPMVAYCPPQEVINALDTGKLWATIIAAGFAVISVILIGIGMFFKHRRGDGGDVLSALGWWIGGTIFVTAAAAIAAIFIRVPTDCVPL